MRVVGPTTTPLQGRPQTLTFKIDLAVVVLIDLINHEIHFLGGSFDSKSVHLQTT